MAFDTDSNFAVSGPSGEGVVATDFVSSAHHQVVKLAFGDSSTATRVQDDTTNALPVKVKSIPSVTVGSVTNAVSINVPAAGITVQAASGGLSIRGLTGGDPSGATLVGSADHIRVYGVSGGFPVGVTASNFGIRSLTGGNPTGATLVGSADHIRVYGVSGGFPVGVTASNFEIRSLTGGNPSEHTPTTTVDTVRVVGISGASPVETLLFGLTLINNRLTRLPLNVDDSGNLRVSVAVGTVGVTATVSGVTLGGAVTIAGVCLPAAATGPTGWASQIFQVQGYKFGWTGAGQTLGWQPIPILTEVTGSFPIRGLSSATDSIAVTGGVAVNGTVSVSGFTGTQLAALAGTVFNSKVSVSDSGLSNLDTKLGNIDTDTSEIVTALGTVPLHNSASGSARALQVAVLSVTQPNGATSGRISVTTSLSQLSNSALQSGVHFKSDLNNTAATIFVATIGAPANSGYPLYNGDQIFIETDNLSRIWVQSTAAGATLYYIGT